MDREARARVENALAHFKPGSFLSEALELLAVGKSEDEVYAWALNHPKHAKRVKQDIPVNNGGRHYKKEDGLMQTVQALKKIVDGNLSEGALEESHTWHVDENMARTFREDVRRHEEESRAETTDDPHANGECPCVKCSVRKKYARLFDMHFFGADCPYLCHDWAVWKKGRG